MQKDDSTFIDEMDKDDAWLKAHLEEIVDRYAHQVIAVLDQQVVGVGTSVGEVHRKVAEQHPTRIPLVFEVPTREEFTCLLSSIATRS